MCWDKILTIKRVLDSKGLFLQASKLMESRDEKAADVKSTDADDDDEKTMDDSPTSNDDDADESTSTTQSAATKSTGNSFS